VNKYSFVLFIVLFTSILTVSQTINIHTKGGSVDRYNLSEIDSITFSIQSSSEGYYDDFSTNTVDGNWEWIGLDWCQGWTSHNHSINWDPGGYVKAVESSGCYTSGFKLKNITFGNGTFSIKAMARHYYHASCGLVFLIDSANWIMFGFSHVDNQGVFVRKSVANVKTSLLPNQQLTTNLDQYYEISIIRNGSEFTFFFNGTQVWSGQISDTVFNGSIPVGIFVYGNTSSTPFYFDDLRYIP